MKRPLVQMIAPNERVIALVGAGGKTTLMYALAHALAARGERILCTTTTKIYQPDTCLLLEDGQSLFTQTVAWCLTRVSPLTVARGVLPDSHKLEGFSIDAIRTLLDDSGADRILIEADGAAGRPLKIPAQHEPVVPEFSDVVIGVMGLDALGQRCGPEMIFRWERLGEPGGAAPWTPAGGAGHPQAPPVVGEGAKLYGGSGGDYGCLTGTVLAARFERSAVPLRPPEAVDMAFLRTLAQHPAGLFKGCPDGARRVVFVNKADEWREREGLPAGWLVGSARQGWFISRS